MATIDIRPRAGAGPVRFGMSREDVHRAIGPPQRQYKKFQSKMLTDCYYRVTGPEAGLDIAR